MERRRIRDLIAEGAIIEIQDGNHGEKHPTSADYVADGVPFLMARDFQGGRVDLGGACKIPKSLGDSLRIGFARTGDVLLTHKGSVGLVAIVPEVRDYLMLTPQVTYYRTDPTKLLNSYLKYAFQTPFFRHQLDSFSAQSTRPYVGITAQKDLQLDVPALPEQRRIAGILSAYDELIENSQRRIRILETMARALYREWFVHFRFPGHENVPRVTSPLGEIPKGWDVVALDALKADQRYAINGGPFGSKLVSRDYVDAGVPVIRGSNLSESGRFDGSGFVFVSEEKAAELHANVAVPGDIVITQRGTLGQIGMIPTGTGFDRFVISQSQMKATLNPDAVNREYAFFFLRSEEAQQRIRNLASSSGVPHINLATLREFQILLPPRELQENFGTFALGTEASIEQLTRQTGNLGRTRDLLLPRLLSGDLRLDTRAA